MSGFRPDRLKLVVLGLSMIVLAALFSACTLDENDAFIQGGWGFANEGGSDRSAEAHLLVEWWFDRGTFRYMYELFYGFPKTLDGDYRIVESDGDTITLELYNLQGTEAYIYENRRTEIRIIIDRENEQIRVNKQLFNRIQ